MIIVLRHVSISHQEVFIVILTFFFLFFCFMSIYSDFILIHSFIKIHFASWILSSFRQHNHRQHPHEPHYHKIIRPGDLKGGSGRGCKNLNDSSNSGNSSGDESSDDGVGDPSPIRSSDHLSHHSLFSKSSSSDPTNTSASAPPGPMYHPNFKFGLSSFGHHPHHSVSHHQSSPFDVTSASSLVMHHHPGNPHHHHSASVAAEAAAMLQLQSAVAAGVDYSSAIGSLPSHHTNSTSNLQ